MGSELFPNDCVTCMSPWYSLRINHNGEYSYCDFTNIRESSDLLPSEWFRHGQAIQRVRSELQQGNCGHGCNKCYTQERNGLISYRSRRNHQAAIYSGNYFKESLNQSPAWARMHEINLPTAGPAFLHVSLSNVCNLACRMCSADSSTKLGTLLVKSQLLPSGTKILQDWTKDPELWEDFCNNLVLNNPSLVCLHFMGGEPLVNDKFFEVLQRCVDQNRTDFHVTFVTNGTVWDNAYVRLLNNFKSVSIEVSIENFHESNDYIRIGSDYKKIQTNIESMIAGHGEKISVVLRTVPQALSIMHYDTVIDFALAHGVNIDYNLLLDPVMMQISVLPIEIRQHVVNHLSNKYRFLLDNNVSHTGPDAINNLRSADQHRKQLTVHIKELISILQQPEPADIEQLRAKFAKYNRTLDQSTGLSFCRVFPDLVEFYEKYNQT
jgi:MoaA/NifB/PqqE/SkfB family radical SAM enzyme